MAIALANNSGLVLTCRVGKHTDSLLDELMSSTEGKTDCKSWNSDDWGGYERILASEISHYTGYNDWSALMGLSVSKQDDSIAARISLFGKVWDQTEVTARLVVSYFNWLWTHSRLKTTAAQRAGLADCAWTWNDMLCYPTIV